jgi:hypothetical protein
MSVPRLVLAALACALALLSPAFTQEAAAQLQPLVPPTPTQTPSEPLKEPVSKHPKSLRTTFLLSRGVDNVWANGPSRNPSVSSDGRIARVIAYESDATNLIGGDTNGLTDVFMARRRKPWGGSGTEWKYRDTVLVSRGVFGQPANGRSYKPATDGDRNSAVSCIAFISEASNLVTDDTNGVADAFVLDLRKNAIQRVSLNSVGQQLDGPTLDVSVDGHCDRIAFTAIATNAAFVRNKGESFKGIKTNRPLPGTRQVYMRFRRAHGNYGYLTGFTFLASANNKGRAGNSHSFDPEFARDGRSLVFTSDANNLAGGDPNHNPDVYRRYISRHQLPATTKGPAQLVPRLRTRLVSANSSSVVGNGQSWDPVSTTDGRYIAYTTRATDLRHDDDNGASDVMRADMKYDPPVQRRISHSDYGIGNGESQRPAMSAIGWVVVFDSHASNLRPRGHKTDQNKEIDLHQWYVKSRRVTLESRDWDNKYVKAGSQNPSMGLHGNYVAFESVEPLIDKSAADKFKSFDRKLIPPLIDPEVVTPSQFPDGVEPSMQQIYVRYIGPCASTVTEDKGVERCFLRAASG